MCPIRIQFWSGCVECWVGKCCFVAFCEAPPAVNNSSRGRARGVRNSCFLLPALPHCLVGGVGGWIVQKSQGVFCSRDVCVFLALSGEDKSWRCTYAKLKKEKKAKKHLWNIWRYASFLQDCIWTKWTSGEKMDNPTTQSSHPRPRRPCFNRC